MSLFDASTFHVVVRPVCAVCGGAVGRSNEKPGTPAKQHDRYDQAVINNRPNPCPGVGQPTK